MIRMYPPDKEGRLLAAFRFHARYFNLAAETIHDHQAAFAALRDASRDNFALFPFFVDGKPTSVIVALGEYHGQIIVQPLFVAADHDMQLVPGLDPASFFAREVTDD